MKILITFTLFSIIFAVINVISSKALLAEDPYWNDLKATFGLDPTIDFTTLPREDFGRDENFTKMHQNETCDSGDHMFQGYRYWKHEDPAIILLFDVNGYIAGRQTGVPQDKWTPSPDILGKYVLNDTGLMILTVYFVDPSIICKSGRNSSQFEMQGTGTDLYIQMGKDPINDTHIIPDTQDEITKTSWGHGKCFYQMGQHYWYDMHKDMKCEQFVPYCLLFNNKKLNAFCFAINADLQHSEHYEHPTPMVFDDFLEPVPDCFHTDPSFHNVTTMHIYFTNDVIDDKC